MIAAMTLTEPMTANFVDDRDDRDERNTKIRFGDHIVLTGSASGRKTPASGPSSETLTAFTSIIGGCRRGRPSGGPPSCRVLSSEFAIGNLRIPRMHAGILRT